MRRFFITLQDFSFIKSAKQDCIENRFIFRNMSYENFIEKQIQKAIAEGKFDRLEGAGKPINLDEYFATPEDVRVGYSVLKSQKFVPEEVERLKEIGKLKEKLNACTDAQEKAKLSKILSEKNLALSIILERNKRKR